MPAEATRSAYGVDGVHCSGCVDRIEEGVGRPPGVAEVHADTSGQVVVEGAVPPATVTQALAKLGFPVQPTSVPR